MNGIKQGRNWRPTDSDERAKDAMGILLAAAEGAIPKGVSVDTIVISGATECNARRSLYPARIAEQVSGPREKLCLQNYVSDLMEFPGFRRHI